MNVAAEAEAFRTNPASSGQFQIVDTGCCVFRHFGCLLECCHCRIGILIGNHNRIEIFVTEEVNE